MTRPPTVLFNKMYSPPPFIGRQCESELVWNEYQIVHGGTARIVLMIGEPGIGKTRLLDELVIRATQDGAIVLRGSTSESEGMPPYLPFLEALGHYIYVTPLDELRQLVGLELYTLASILPELATRLEELPTSYHVHPEQERLRLYKAIGTLLEAISLSHMLVFTIDDLQWADTASLDLLCYIMRQHSHTRLLIVSTCREAEFRQNPAINRAICELNRQRILTITALNPLSAEEIEALATSYLGNPLSPNVKLLLQAESEGNPFFAEEILRCWVEAGTLVQRDGLWVAMAPLECTLPHSIVGALRQRFSRLSTFAIDHLRIAAVIGRIFDISVLAELEGQEVEIVEEAIHEAVRAHLVKIEQNGLFIFSHDKIRETLYAEVSISRRRRLHKAICQMLESRHCQDDGMSLFVLAQLAFHASKSGDRERGVKYLQLAAQQALHSFADDDVVMHYCKALKLLDADDERYGPLLLYSGQAILLSGNDKQAIAVYQEALDRFLQRGEQKAAGQAAHGLGKAQWQQEALYAARETLEYALTLLAPPSQAAPQSQLAPQSQADFAQALVDLSILLTFYLERSSEGNVYAEQALAIAESTGDKALKARVRWAITGQYIVSEGNPAKVLQILERGRGSDLVRTDVALDEATEYCLYLAEMYYYTARVQHSHLLKRRATQFVEHHCNPYQACYSQSWSALLFASQGAWKDAELALGQAQSLVERLSPSASLAFFHQVCGFLAYQKEDYATAEQEFRLAQAHPSRNPSGLAYTGLLALTQMISGKDEEASYSKVELEALLGTKPSNALSTAPILVCLALMAITSNDQKQAAHLYPKLLMFRNQHHWFLVDRVLGEMAALLGKEKQAMQHFSEAEKIAKREELRPEQARILVAQANLYQKMDSKRHTSLITMLFEQALVLFKELHLTQKSTHILHQLAKLSQGLPTVLSQSLPVKLTPSEAKVLSCVIEGKSNRQVAEQLGISEKTVANHLAHIFSKTRSDNRTAAVAFAMRHGLTVSSPLPLH